MNQKAHVVRNAYKSCKTNGCRQDVLGMSCAKDHGGNIVMKEAWRKCMEKLLSEKNTWNKDTKCEKQERRMGIISSNC